MAQKWQEIYSIEEIKKIQRIELESLKVFSAVCEKLNIKFFLYGGSLLGAVKYNGFVPWDDDLDVALLREDYEKLIKLGPFLLPEKYELQHPSINKYTPYPYIKFRRTDTEMVEYINHKVKINHGVYFDIYPIDNVPDDDIIYAKQHKKLLFIMNLFSLRQSYLLSRPINDIVSFIKAVVKWGLFVILHLIPHSFFVKKFDEIMTEFNSEDTKRQGNYFHKEPTNHFDGVNPPITVLFENMEMLIPNGYKVNLENRYGDISKLPPEEERFGHIAYLLELGE